MSAASSRPFVLRRAWFAWSVAALVAVAGVIGNGWMLRERSAATGELADARRDLPAVSARADELAERNTALTEGNEERRGELQRCLDRHERRIAAYNELNAEYGSTGVYPDSAQASRFRERFLDLREKAEADLQRCRRAAENASG